MAQPCQIDFVADLTGQPSGSYVSPSIVRSGNCCGTTAGECITFQVTLDPGAIGLVFEIASGAVPSGALFYKINCGPDIAVGTDICLTGGQTYNVTFCKPGNNQNTYRITSITDLSAPAVTAKAGCATQLQALVYNNIGTISWNGVTPGTNAWLSCTNCLNPTFTPPLNASSPISYNVTWTATGFNCNTTISSTKRLDVTVVPPPTVFLSPASLDFCQGTFPNIIATVSGAGGYSIQWYSGAEATGSLVGSGTTFTPPQTPGSYTYSVKAFDTSDPCNYTIQNISIVVRPAPVLNLPNLTLCAGDVRTITLNPAETYSWSPSTGVTNLGGGKYSLYAGSNQTYTVTATNSLTCSTTASFQTSVQPCISSCPALGTRCDTTAFRTPVYATVSQFTAAGGVINFPCSVPDGNISLVGQSMTGTGCPGTATRLYRIVDNCGNADTCAQVFQINDVTSPVFTTPTPSFSAITCDQPLPAQPNLLATDNCALPAITKTIDPYTINTCTGYTVTYRWKAVDKCGNESNTSTTVQVLPDNTAPTFSSFPADTTVSCNHIPGIQTPVILDNCDPTPQLTYVLTETPGTCAQQKTMTYTWTATDACGNTRTKSQVIHVVDTTAPVLSNVPSNMTVSCDAVPPMGTPSATDNCAAPAAISITSTETRTNGACPSSYSLTRTWTATDPCGNSSSATQVITVRDTTPPILSAHPADLSVSCDQVPTAVSLSATDNCDAAPGVVFAQTRTNGSCPGNYTLHRTWTATDACSNTDIFTQHITVSDTSAPVFNNFPDDASVACNAIPAPAIPSFSDNCDPNPVLTISESKLPGSCPFNYILQRQYTIRDTCGNSTSRTQYFLVTDTEAPVLSATPKDTTLDCTQIPTAAILTATDNCDPTPRITFSEAIEATCATSYRITRTWTATDTCGNHSTHTQTITVQDNTPPTLSALPADTTVNCAGVPTAPTITATDNCSPNLLVQYNETRQDGSCSYNYQLIRTWSTTDLCGNLTSHTQHITVQDNTPPVLSGIPADVAVFCQAVPSPATPAVSDNCDPNPVLTFQEDTLNKTCPGNYQLRRTWTATDQCGNQRSAIQLITVSDNEAPQFSTTPANMSGTCEAVPSAPVISINDQCDPSPLLTFLQDSLPGTCPGNYTLIRTWTARDWCNNIGSVTQTIQIQDQTKPSWSSPLPPDLSAPCDAVPDTAQMSATDNCDANPIIDFTESKITGACPGAYTLLRTWKATDQCGNTISHTQTITVEDQIDPLFVQFPADTAVSCDAIPAVVPPLVADNCDPNPNLQLNEARIDGSCPSNYSILRTWTLRDACGNSILRTQTLQVYDTVAPVLSNLPADITADCANIPAASTITASDNCDPNPLLEFTETSGNSCAVSYQITRTWKATDQCGNQRTHTQVITVEDNKAPQFNNPPGNITVSCDAVPPVPVLTASDDCTPTLVINFSETRTNGNCAYNYLLTRTWTATDLCGNTGTHIQEIQVRDTEGPVFNNTPPDAAVTCQSIPPTATPSATDNCDPNPLILFSTDTINQSCPATYTLKRIWKATDVCNNETQYIQTISVSDTEAPLLSEDPSDLSAACGGVPDAPLLTATDACDPFPQLNLTVDSIPGTCPGNYRLNRIWTATDWCGNSSTVAQQVVVEDNIPPYWVNFPTDESVACTAIPAPPIVLAADSCDPAPIITYSETAPTACANGKSFLTRTWIARDACGNQVSDEQILTIVDSIPPTILNAPPSQIADCSNIPAPATPIASDNCDPSPTLDFDEVTEDSCATGYAITRTWTATDACGNISVHVQVITVQDLEAPVWQNAPANVTVSCESVPAVANPTVTDNCDPDPATSYKETRIDGTCPNTYLLERVWTAIDRCGNIGVHTQQIQVEDKTPPSLNGVPADATVGCDAIPSPALPEVSDNCDPNPQITLTETIIPGSCSGNYQIKREWLAKDTCGNSSGATQIITVVDLNGPTFLDIPPDTTVSCDAIPSAPEVHAADDCDPSPQVSLSENSIPGSCPGAYILERTWLAEDDCGNISFKTQRMTVQDLTPPVFNTTPTDLTVACDAIPTPPNLSATDNCDPFPEVTFSEAISGACVAGSYTIQRSWTARDACGNQHTITQLITVEDKFAPVLSETPADEQVTCSGVPAVPIVVATDNCTSIVEVHFNEYLENQTCPNSYQLRRVWSATDSCGNTATHTQVIQVSDTEAPVLQNVPGDVAVDCKSIPAPATPDATDNCDPHPVITLTEQIIAGSCPQNYQIERVWTARDSCGNSSTARQVIQVSDAVAPILTGIPADETVSCTAIPTPAAVTLSDDCDPAPLFTFQEDTLDQTCAFAYKLQRTWTGKDACGNTVSATQNIQVHDTEAPVLIGLEADSTISCAAIPGAPTIQAQDNCDPSPFVAMNETFTAGNCIGEGTLTRVWTATDACGNMASATQVLLIRDTEAPLFNNPPADLTVSCQNIPGAVTLSVDDDCDPAPSLSFEETISPDCQGSYTIIRKWMTRDDCSNERTHQQIITVIDNEPPQLYGIPGDQQLKCGEVPTEATPTALDNCDANLNIIYTQDSIPGTCAFNYVLVRKWMVIDQCGNAVEKKQTITYADTQAPTWANIPSDLVLDCTDPIPDADPIALDECTNAPLVIRTDSLPPSLCPQTFIQFRIWRATDLCGNSSAVTQRIEVKDITPPVLQVTPADEQTTCDAIPSIATVTATDNCDPAPKVLFVEKKIPGTCVHTYVLERTWTAKDTCGNSSTYTQRIQVEDTEAPIISTPPADVVIHCKSALPPMIQLDWSDNCGASGKISGTDISDGGTNPEIITRTWTITDSCGWSAAVSQTIRIESLQGTVSNDSPVCIGEDVHLSGSGGDTYAWSGPGGFSASGATVTLGAVDATKAGTYTLTLTDNQGCTQTLNTQVSILSPAVYTLQAQICKGQSYTLQGQTFDSTGIYPITLPGAAANGCDSTIQLHLSAVDASINEVSAIICPGNSYTINGKTYMAEGDYTDVLPNASSGGCDSIILLHLSIRNQIVNKLTVDICEGASYTLNGITYTSSINTSQVLAGAATGGCDSLIELTLTVHPIPQTNIQASICRGTTYKAGGQSFGETGNYTVTLPKGSSFKCDSIVQLGLTVLEIGRAQIPASICQGEVYSLNGSNFNKTGTYHQLLKGKAANGCDSTIELQLTVLPIRTGTLKADICQGETFQINGASFDQTGTFTQRLANAGSNGCDSILTISLTVHTPSQQTIRQTICKDQTYTLNGETFSQSGVYTQHFTNQYGCDSTLTLQLTKLGDLIATIDKKICEGSLYPFDGQSLTDPGTYTQFLPGGSRDGCDSTTILHLSVGLPSSKDTSVTLCAGGIFQIGSFTFNESGTYTRTLTAANAAQCDSTVRLQLTILPEVSSTTKATICEGNTYRFFGKTYSTEGIYTIRLPRASINGCDSILYLDLKVAPKAVHSFQKTICPGTTYSFFGKTLSLPGTYRQLAPVPAQSGCDSIEELHLIVLEPARYTLRETICKGDSYQLAGKSYTQAGTYQITLPQATTAGCDSLITLVLETKPEAFSRVSPRICNGDTLFVRQKAYFIPGTYRDTLPAAASNGCDSIVETVLSFYPIASKNLTANLCPNRPYVLNGEPFSLPGTYTQLLPAASSNGCDSLIQLQLSQTAVDTPQLKVQLCDQETYALEGVTYREPGTFLVPNQRSDPNQCSDLAWLNIKKGQRDTTYFHRDICEGDSLFFNMKYQHETGTYTRLFTNKSGCDSLIILDLQVHEPSTSIIDTLICLGDKLQQWGKSFAVAGQYTIPLQSVYGCDSTLILRLSVEPADTHRLSAQICTGSYYTLNGQRFFNSGTFVQRLPDASIHGCDSIILLTLETTDRIEGYLSQTICAGGSVSINNLTYFKAGTYDQLLPKKASSGCDSLLHITLQEVQASTGTLRTALCTGDTLLIQGRRYFAPGTYTQTLPKASYLGCDSVLTVEITSIPTAQHQLRTPLCRGDSIQVGGQTFRKPGTHTIRLDNASANGCDSTIFLEIYQIEPAKTNLVASVCTGDYYAIDTARFYLAGDYTHTLDNRAQNGCDSIVSLRLQWWPLPITSVFDTLCYGGSTLFMDSLIQQSGQYAFVLPRSSQHGCDSTVVLHLLVRDLPQDTLNLPLCPGDSIAHDGRIYTQSGDYTRRYEGGSRTGCDSLLHLHIIDVPIAENTVSRRICSGDSLAINGEVFRNAGTYVQTLPAGSVYGCDSLLTLHLEVIDTSRQHLQFSICPGDSIQINQDVFKAPGTYRQVFHKMAASGCDSQLILTILPLEVAHTVSHDTICEGSSRILGDSAFVRPGVYSYTFFGAAANGCDSTVQLHLQVYPNPTQYIDTLLFENDTLVLNGFSYTEAGTYTQFFSGASENGCDSTLVITLQYNGTSCNDTLYQELSLCYGDSSDLRMADYFERLTAGASWILTHPAGAKNVSFDPQQGILRQAGNYPGLYTMTQVPPRGAPCPKTWLIARIQVMDPPTVEAGPDQQLTCKVPQVRIQGSTCNGCILVWRDAQGRPLDAVQSDILVTQPGKYILHTTDPRNGCSASDSVLVTQDTLHPIADAGADQVISCIEHRTQPDAGGSSQGAGIQYTWTALSGQTPTPSNTLMTTISEPGKYLLQVQRLSNGCIATDTLEVFQDPDAVTGASWVVEGPNCDYSKQGSFQILQVQGGIPPYTYSLEGVATQHTTLFEGLMPGTYTVRIEDATGCRLDTSFSIWPPNDAIAIDLGPDQHLFLGDTASIKPTFNFPLDSLLSFKWTTPKGLFACDTCQHQQFAPTHTDTYQAVAMNLSGCTTSDLVTIYVDERGRIYAPNAFSPNGDGVNDLFRLYSDESAQEVELLQVYDRWGNELFTAAHFPPNDPNVGWDGTYRGKPLDPAVFVFYARVRLINGNLKQLKGGVTLVR